MPGDGAAHLMGIFSRQPAPTLEAAPPVPVPVAPPVEGFGFDEFLGDPFAHHLAREGAAGNWRAFHDACEEVDDPYQRYFYAGVLADLESFPQGWFESTAGSQFPLVARGAFLISQAWKARGTGPVETVDPSAWPRFRNLLLDAERDLGHAAALRPGDPGPWARSILTGTGLGAAKPDLLNRFSETRARAADFHPAFAAIISAVSKRWEGSHELMFETAGQIDATVPDGSPGRVAVLRAHFERRLHYAVWERNSDLARSYYRDPAVRADVERATRYSVFSSYFRPDALTPMVWVEFAYALSLTGEAEPGDWRAAAWVFDRLGERGVPAGPWRQRFGSSAEAEYEDRRNLCRQAAASAP